MSRRREPFPMEMPRQHPSRYGLLASFGLHLALALFIILGGRSLVITGRGAPSLFAGGGGGGAGGGDGQIRYVTLAPPPPQQTDQAPQDTPPVEVPTEIPPPEPEEEEEEVPEEEEVVAQVDTTATAPSDTLVAAVMALGEGVGEGEEGLGPGSGGGSGGGEGTGSGTGIGSGTGPGSGGGGGLARDPEPRQLLLPPEVKDKDQRGTFVDVVFYVRPDGRVQRVEVDPEPRNRKYAKEFRQRMEGYLFRPARSAEGSPIAGVFRIKVGL